MPTRRELIWRERRMASTAGAVGELRPPSDRQVKIRPLRPIRGLQSLGHVQIYLGELSSYLYLREASLSGGDMGGQKILLMRPYPPRQFQRQFRKIGDFREFRVYAVPYSISRKMAKFR